MKTLMLSFLTLASFCVGATWGVKLVKPYNRCYAEIDLGFLIDGSHSINAADSGNYQRCLDFVQRIASGFEISPLLTRVGAVVYSTFASVVMDIRAHKDLNGVLKGIKGFNYPDRGTRTGHALELVKAQLFPSDRKNTRKVLVVLTDGRSSDDVTAPAKALKDDKVEIFTVGIGDSYRKSDLKSLATDDKHVFTAGFESLLSIEKKVRDDVCYSKVLDNIQTQCPPCYHYHCCCPFGNCLFGN